MPRAIRWPNDFNYGYNKYRASASSRYLTRSSFTTMAMDNIRRIGDSRIYTCHDQMDFPSLATGPCLGHKFCK